MRLNNLWRIKAVYFLIALLFLGYVLLRAIFVGATYDELTTMFGCVPWEFWQIIYGLIPDANNHPLNTAIIKILHSLFGDSLWVSRLPNVLSFILYLYFGYKLTSRNLSKWLGLGAFFVLCCNPFLLDFFGLARGYGMSIAFMMGGLYFCVESVKSFSLDKNYKSLIFCSLSVFSLYSMIYSFLGVFIILNLLALLGKNRNLFKKALGGNLIVSGMLFLVVAPGILHLKSKDAFFYGGHDGFYDDTLWSLVRYSLYNADWSDLSYRVLHVSCVIAGAIIVFSFIKKRALISVKSSFLFLLIFLGLILVLLNHFIDVAYPINRVALFLYPLIALLLFFCLNDLGRGWRAGAMSIFVLALGGNFFANANINKVVVWSFDSYSERIVNEINRIGETQGKVATLGYDPIFSASVGYYLGKDSVSFVRGISSHMSREVPDEADFYIHLSKDPSAAGRGGYENKYWEERLDLYDKTIFIEYPDVNITVFRGLKKRQDG